MPATAEKLPLAEFERQYAGRKPHYEYWFGDAIPKAMPTWLHGLLQKILMKLLDEAGYKSAPEVKLRIGPDFQPVPDVIATSGRIELPYPTTPVDVVVEILSPEDSFERVVRKCKLYAAWGVGQIVVIDPDARECWVWTNDTIPLKPGVDIFCKRIFDELDSALQ